MIYAVDFDGTLSKGQYPNVGPANDKLFKFLITRRHQGNRVILWTCRTGKELDEAVEFCYKNGLIFDAVNDNLPEIVQLYGTNSRKIIYDMYIDDRTVKADNYLFTGEVDFDKIENALERFADRMRVSGLISDKAL